MSVNKDENTNIVQSNDNNVNFESFKKNAVHVNDLENHWQAEASKVLATNVDTNKTNGKGFSSSGSSPLSSSFDSPISSSTTVSSPSATQSNQQIQLCFISCLKKYRNITLDDKTELSINNYANLINYIYSRKL